MCSSHSQCTAHSPRIDARVLLITVLVVIIGAIILRSMVTITITFGKQSQQGTTLTQPELKHTYVTEETCPHTCITTTCDMPSSRSQCVLCGKVWQNATHGYTVQNAIVVDDYAVVTLNNIGAAVWQAN